MCPLWPVTATLEGSTKAVSATAFEFLLRHQACLGQQTDDGVDYVAGIGGHRRCKRAFLCSRISAHRWFDFIGGAKICGGNRVERGLVFLPLAARPPGHLKEGACVGRCRVSLLRLPALSLERDIVQLLLRRHQQIVEPVDFGRRVGESPERMYGIN